MSLIYVWFLSILISIDLLETCLVAKDKFKSGVAFFKSNFG